MDSNSLHRFWPLLADKSISRSPAEPSTVSSMAERVVPVPASAILFKCGSKGKFNELYDAHAQM